MPLLFLSPSVSIVAVSRHGTFTFALLKENSWRDETIQYNYNHRRHNRRHDKTVSASIVSLSNTEQSRLELVSSPRLSGFSHMLQYKDSMPRAHAHKQGREKVQLFWKEKSRVSRWWSVTLPLQVFHSAVKEKRERQNGSKIRDIYSYMYKFERSSYLFF